MSENRILIKQSLRKNLILKILRESGEPLSTAELSRRTVSNFPTVSSLLSKMKDEGTVLELGPGKSTGGRRPVLFRLNKERIFFAGIEIGHTNCIAVIVNIENEIMYEDTYSSRDIVEAKNPLEALAKISRDFFKNNNISTEHLLGIGFGFTGDLVEKFSGFKVNGPRIFHEIEKKLSGYLDVPVLIENDARLLTSAEKWFGKLKGVKNGLCINISWGIGMGVVMGGIIQNGNGAHGGVSELGHITVEKDGDICYCGKRGCLETLASGHALIKKAKERIKAGEKTKLTDMVDGTIDALNEEVIVRAALEGDIFSIELITEAANILGLQIANLIKLFDPEKIVLSGTLARAGRLLINPIKTEIDKRALYYMEESMPVEISDLGETAIALGAASLHMQDFLDVSDTDIEKFV